VKTFVDAQERSVILYWMIKVNHLILSCSKHVNILCSIYICIVFPCLFVFNTKPDSVTIGMARKR